MKDRVRAILVTPTGHLLTIKRVRPGMAPYWVLPGGGVEKSDADLETALRREIREELGGEINIQSLISVQEGQDREYFFLANISSWDVSRRSGPEFGDPARGEYIVEQIPLTAADLARIAATRASPAAAALMSPTCPPVRARPRPTASATAVWMRVSQSAGSRPRNFMCPPWEARPSFEGGNEEPATRRRR
ncbi:NUDIX domain-containing protein [Nonomuraea sp. NPDC005983]|uniref:NUDIX hydrolase n=1 Tax=Nonomuraea sp. NPDC005983 TaxID=3155595 RepID=UPI0033A82337